MTCYPVYILAVFLWVIPQAASAQADPFSLDYRAAGRVSMGEDTAQTFDVEIKNRFGPEQSHVRVRLIMIAGDIVQGSIDFGRLRKGESVKKAGDFTAPTGFWEEVPLENLIWEITYTDSSGTEKKQFYRMSGK